MPPKITRAPVDASLTVLKCAAACKQITTLSMAACDALPRAGTGWGAGPLGAQPGARHPRPELATRGRATRPASKSRATRPGRDACPCAPPQDAYGILTRTHGFVVCPHPHHPTPPHPTPSHPPAPPLPTHPRSLHLRGRDRRLQLLLHDQHHHSHDRRPARRRQLQLQLCWRPRRATLRQRRRVAHLDLGPDPGEGDRDRSADVAVHGVALPDRRQLVPCNQQLVHHHAGTVGVGAWSTYSRDGVRAPLTKPQLDAFSDFGAREISCRRRNCCPSRRQRI